MPRGSPLSGLHMEPKLARGSANAVIKTQTDFANVLAQPVLQIPKAHALHIHNVAS
jgi:hypothetical protein